MHPMRLFVNSSVKFFAYSLLFLVVPAFAFSQPSEEVLRDLWEAQQSQLYLVRVLERTTQTGDPETIVILGGERERSERSHPEQSPE